MNDLQLYENKVPSNPCFICGEENFCPTGWRIDRQIYQPHIVDVMMEFVCGACGCEYKLKFRRAL
jgi:hypothetical protein